MGELLSLRFSLDELEDEDDDFGDVVRPEDEEFGGYAFELFYLQNRFRAPDHLVGAELERYHKWELDPMVKRLNEIMEPTPSDVAAYNHAVKLFERHRRHGKPVDGPWRDQPARWLHVMDCLLAAQEQAESERHREEAQKAEEEKRSAAQG